eukprot:scaffold432412_cov40-Prasinocladus_malaysianus.AAC.1
MQEYCVSRIMFELFESQPWQPIRVTSYSKRNVDPPPELASFAEVRKSYLANAVYCRPFWLYNGLDRKWACNAEAYGMYAKLSAELHCENPSDKVRALLPVLINIPVEYQEELELLVKQVLDLIGGEDESLKAFLA